MRPIFVLLWKYMKEKIRRPIHTIWEILTGVLVFLVLLFIKKLLADDSKHIQKFMQDFNMVDIVFAPTNALSLTLMAHICSNDFNNTASGGTVLKCYGLPDEKSMEPFIKQHNFSLSDTLAAISFHNLDGKDFPDQLDYEIKFSTSSNHPVTQLIDLYHIYQNDFNIAKDTTFLANLQWGVDKIFLEKLSGQEIDHKLNFHDILQHITPEMRIIHNFLLYCSVMAPLPFFMYTSSSLVIEKRSGLKELIKLVGVSRTTVNMAYLLGASVFALIYGVLIAMLLKVSETPILPHSGFVNLAIFFFLHYLTVVSLAFITSTLSQNYQHSDSLALLLYLMTFMINKLWNHPSVTNRVFILFICCLLPHAPVFLFWDEVTNLEERDRGTDLINMWQSQGSEAVALILMSLVIQLVLCMTLSWYLDMVRPGRYGVAAKWNFCFKKRYWIKKQKTRGVNFHVSSEKRTSLMKDDRFFEKISPEALVSVKIAQVTKVFRGFRQPSVRALDSVTLNVYKGEIAVLLGVNGAGKSTLLAIVTGMYSATEGTVYINGLDNSTRLQDLNQDMAYCPQKDLTFDYLTVRENLVFFQRLRGTNREMNAYAMADNVLLNLKLDEKADYYSRQLSSGLRRCLQVGCVLVGNADVLVLDEPTSGMDANMRHNIWDLLLTLRKEKTILMTSTIMEEADALGDRIAILNQGKLKCHGSPDFLKNAIGANFKVTIRLSKTEKDINDSRDILEQTLDESEITSPLRNVHVMDENRISISLPAQDRDHFPKVFDMLESKRKELGITAVDVGMSMEQVFLRFIEDDETIDPDFGLNDDFLRVNRLQGCKLVGQQIKVLMVRVFTFILAYKYQFITLQILVPFIAIIIITVTSNEHYGYGKVYDDFMNKELATVLYNPVGYRSTNVFNPLMQYYPNISFITSSDLLADMDKLPNTVKSNVVGYKMIDNHTDVFFRSQEPHKLTQAVNIFSNMFMSLNMPYATSNHINMKYSPLNAKPKVKKPKNIFMCLAWSVWTSFMSIATVGPLILLSFDEYRKSVRFRHLLAGCNPSVIWLSKLLAHLCIYILVVPTIVVVVAASLDFDNTFNRPYFLLTLYFILLVFGPAFFIHWYMLSFIVVADNPVTLIYIMSLGCCIIGPILLIAMLKLTSSWLMLVPVSCVYVLLHSVPPFVLSVALGSLTIAARHNAYCRLNFHLCPNFPRDSYVSVDMCCNSKDGEPFDYMDSVKIQVILLVVLSLLYWSLLVMLQHRAIQAVWEKIQNFMYKAPSKKYITLRVKREEEYVNETLASFKEMSPAERERDPDVILASDVHKVYEIKKAGISVKGVSFSVRRGECLGIIGRNSSGKSTILGLLSGYITMTRGEACANGYFLHSERRKYLRNVAYAVSSGFDDFLSGLKNLELLASLYGYPKSMSQRVAMYYLRYMGLITYSHTLFSSYSAGCSKRLSVCTALLGAAKVALLDEPYGSVDPHMRVLITRAILRMRGDNVSCVIAEESMEWKQVDLVCTRLAILDHGEIVALGSVAEMRRELASGYSANIKLKVEQAYISVDDPSETEGLYSYKSLAPVEAVYNLKREFLDVFPTSILLDEHMSVLYFHIRDTEREIPYSEMFSKLERLKKKFSIVEDYILSETSLEEVLSRIEQQLHGNLEVRSKLLRVMHDAQS